jgi:DNA-directed RNA polymerase I, II, and III subunit RPABC1
MELPPYTPKLTEAELEAQASVEADELDRQTEARIARGIETGEEEVPQQQPEEYGRANIRRRQPGAGSLMSRLFRVKKTQIRMLEDRGYDVSGEARLLTDKINQFINIYDQKSREEETGFVPSLSNLYDRKDGADPVYVFYPSITPGSKLLSKAHLEPLYQLMKPNTQIRHFIIISEIPLSSGSRKSLMEDLPRRRSEHFLYSEMTFLVPEHMFVPPHYLLTQDERNRFLQEERTNFSELPTISVMDPMARYLGSEVGDIIRVNRFAVHPTAMVKNTLAFLGVRDVPIVRTKE